MRNFDSQYDSIARFTIRSIRTIPPGFFLEEFITISYFDRRTILVTSEEGNYGGIHGELMDPERLDYL